MTYHQHSPHLMQMLISKIGYSEERFVLERSGEKTIQYEIEVLGNREILAYAKKIYNCDNQQELISFLKNHFADQFLALWLKSSGTSGMPKIKIPDHALPICDFGEKGTLFVSKDQFQFFEPYKIRGKAADLRNGRVLQIDIMDGFSLEDVEELRNWRYSVLSQKDQTYHVHLIAKKRIKKTSSDKKRFVLRYEYDGNGEVLWYIYDLHINKKVPGYEKSGIGARSFLAVDADQLNKLHVENRLSKQIFNGY